MFQCRVEQPALPTIGKTARASGMCTGRPRLCSGGSGLSRAARRDQTEREIRGFRHSKGNKFEGRIQKGYSRGSPADDSARPGGAEPLLARAGSFYGAAIKRRFCVGEMWRAVASCGEIHHRDEIHHSAGSTSNSSFFVVRVRL